RPSRVRHWQGQTATTTTTRLDITKPVNRSPQSGRGEGLRGRWWPACAHARAPPHTGQWSARRRRLVRLVEEREGALTCAGQGLSALKGFAHPLSRNQSR